MAPVIRLLKVVAAFALLVPTSVFAQSREDWLNARDRTDRAVEQTRAATLAAPEPIDAQEEPDRTVARSRSVSPAASNSIQKSSVIGALSLVSWRSFPDSFGDEVVVGEIQNNTGTTLTFAKVIFDFYNGGALVGSDYSYAFGSQNGRLALTGSYVSILPPGAIGFFKVWTSLPYSGITSLSFRNSSENAALAPVFASVQLGSISLASNWWGGTDFTGTLKNASGSFSTFFTKVFVAGYSNGAINDVTFTYVDGATNAMCGTTSTPAVLPGETAGYSYSFSRSVSVVSRVATEWDEYGITPAAKAFATSGGTGSVSVVGNCKWTAVSNVNWITITGGASGASDGTVSFFVAPNTQQARTGTMTINGQTFTVTQAGNSLLPTLSLFWRNSVTGANVVWRMSGTTLVGQQSLQTVNDLAWQLVASADINADGQLDLIWRNCVNGENVVWLMNGPSNVGQISLPPVTDLSWQLVAAGDFNADGHPDLIWRNGATGANVVWYLNAATLIGQASLPAVAAASWQIAASADMNQDGRPDLIWRNSETGANSVWFMNDTTLLSQIGLQSVADPTWMLMEAVDVDLDGRSDLVWRNSKTGANVVWFMNGATLLGQSSLQTAADPAWRMLGAWPPAVPVDVNGDRRRDLVWRHANGSNVVWLLNGTTLTGQIGLETVANPAWKIVGSVDIDGDTHPDLVWRNSSTGANLVWFMVGNAIASQVGFPSVADTNWEIVAVADINKDMHPDLIWRHAITGANVVWFMNGTTLLSQANLPPVADTAWRIAGAANINADTYPDLIWRNAATGANVVWFLQGTSLIDQAQLEAVADLHWNIVALGDMNGDSRPDLIWRNSGSGENVVWFMNGATRVGQASLQTVSDLNWSITP
jgi:hypothetical protein